MTLRPFFNALLGFGLLWLPASGSSQVADTGTVLKKVTVSALRKLNPFQQSMPAQVLDRNTLQQLNALSVGEATRYFSGVLVKDYGGIGGLKTISVRSLGANHTGVAYDGLLLSEAQSGQIDLGKLSIDNIESAALFVGQPADLLMPARLYTYASVLQLRTGAQTVDTSHRLAGRIGLRAGSFGMINGSGLINYAFSSRVTSSLNLEWQQADGNYPFTAYEGNAGKTDRANSDIQSFRAEYDLGIRLSDSNRIRIKTYFYDSDRGLPGMVVLYASPSRQRLADRNFFTQASWQRSFSPKHRLLLSSKYSYNYNRYTDPDYANTQRYLKNTFHLQETYLSIAYAYTPISNLSLAYSSDYFITSLRRTDTFVVNFPGPTRNSLLNNVSARWSQGPLEIQGNLLHTYQQDRVKQGKAGEVISRLSPAISLGYELLPMLRLRLLYKDIFRTPSFNDLYYTNFGNTDLRPEHARQYNAGASLRWAGHPVFLTGQLSVDAYVNQVTDKIIAIPRQNLFQWSMLNLGKVTSKGLDVSLLLEKEWTRGLLLSARLAYTYQQALDKTSKSSVLYNTQVPYIPEHSGSVVLNARYRQWGLGYNVLLSGYRYRLGEAIPENLVKEWATQDLQVSYQLAPEKAIQYRISLELNNLFNKQYEVIRYYPMPGSNYRLGLTLTFR
ncbi:MAG: TonB-dependent receptor [Candidatus Pseudobacter hemicellulosilyticus]|uniref:TonB-dependent receptor n=1 Tax=Candidatus Pseudobacter hemicellulosilyticus TaxID=3121375 RepID=A0AAJ5WRV5_9BACT|nr:MAG: TonB-dependent receptor [Pseudobacter sp.]